MLKGTQTPDPNLKRRVRTHGSVRRERRAFERMRRRPAMEPDHADGAAPGRASRDCLHRPRTRFPCVHDRRLSARLAGGFFRGGTGLEAALGRSRVGYTLGTKGCRATGRSSRGREVAGQRGGAAGLEPAIGDHASLPGPSRARCGADRCRSRESRLRASDHCARSSSNLGSSS